MILVTGATGLLGSHLCTELVKQGKDVLAIKRNNQHHKYTQEIFGFYDLTNLFEKIKWVEADLLDFFSLEDIFKQYSITEIYHCAALVSFEPRDHAMMFRVNIEGTANMVNLALQYKVTKFCHVSSIASIPGDGKTEFLHEKMIWKSSPSHTAYAVSKYGAEREVWRGQEEGLNVVIVNPGMIIGPGCWDQSSSVLFKNCEKGVKFYTPGGTAVVDVRDVVICMVLLMEKNIFSERFLLTGENLSFQQILRALLKGFNHPEPKLQVGKFLFRVAYRMERLMSVFNGKKPRLSKDFLRSGFAINKYDSSKVMKATGIRFHSYSESIEWSLKFYKKLKNE